MSKGEVTTERTFSSSACSIDDPHDLSMVSRRQPSAVSKDKRLPSSDESKVEHIINQFTGVQQPVAFDSVRYEITANTSIAFSAVGYHVGYRLDRTQGDGLFCSAEECFSQPGDDRCFSLLLVELDAALVMQGAFVSAFKLKDHLVAFGDEDV